MIKALKTLAMAGTIAISGAACASTPQEDTVDLHSYILLDRTGSMNSIWDEALGSVNAYAGKVTTPDEGPDVRNTINLAVFDAQDGLQFDMLRRNVTDGGWADITSDEVAPRGMTPLFDAIGRVISVAEADAPEKAVIVIMTDGRENASREYNRKTVRDALDRVEKKGWEVVFLGAEFASFGDADAAGISSSKQMAVSKDRLESTMENLAQKNRAYAQESAPVEFDDADRALADEEDVKRRKGPN